MLLWNKNEGVEKNRILFNCKLSSFYYNDFALSRCQCIVYHTPQLKQKHGRTSWSSIFEATLATLLSIFIGNECLQVFNMS